MNIVKLILKSNMGGIQIQKGEKGIVKANSKQLTAVGWVTIFSACFANDALEELVRKLNANEIEVGRHFYRIIVGKTVIKL